MINLSQSFLFKSTEFLKRFVYSDKLRNFTIVVTLFSWNKNREFETVDLDNSPPQSARHVTHTIEIQMQEQEPPTNNNENTFQVDNSNEHNSITNF